MEDGIFFNQSKYIKEILKKFGLDDSKPMKTPMSSDTKLTKDEECESVDSTKYRGMIGSLLYLTTSRPDIMFSVCLCARFQEAPKTSHLEAVKRIFRYIKGTTHLGLWYPKGTDIETVVYADSDHAGDYVDRKSTSVSKNDVLYFNAIPCDGIYEIDMLNLAPNVNSIYNVSNKRAKHNSDSTYLWHYRLAHISKKRIENLQHDGLLKSTDYGSFDQCVSCLSDTCQAKLTPPYTPQYNGMFERRNHTLLDMVRSMMNLITLSLSFCNYALESAIRIFNIVPTKKVDKIPYELWYGKVPNLSYLKVWGCEALVKRDTLDKLQQRSVKCNFVGYPKGTMEVSGRAVELEEIQDEDTSASENTREILLSLRMQSIKDNQVWCLVDLPYNGKTVGSKWPFKKKTNMDGNVHTYKARLVAKGKYASFKYPFIDLNKHQEAGIKDLIRISKGFTLKGCYTSSLVIQGCRIQKPNKKLQAAKGKGKGKGKGKNKLVYASKLKNPKPAAKEHPTKDDSCHHYKEDYTLESATRIRNIVPIKKFNKTPYELLYGKVPNLYPKETLGYVDEEKEASWHWQYFRGAKKLKQGADYLYMGNGICSQVGAFGSFNLVLPNGLVIYYGISVSKDDVLYFNTIPCDAKHNLDSTYLWHYRLTHISKKRIEKLQHDGLLKSIDSESFDQYASCLSGKMTRKPFPHRTERDESYNYVVILWDYALKSATRILNMVLTRKVDKTPYKLLFGKVLNLSYLKEWGFEVLVKRDRLDKLQQRSVKCIFVGYPKETLGYYFYFPPKNKIAVARYVDFLEKNLISQEASGREVELREIQDKDTSTSKNTSKNLVAPEGFEPPQEDVAPVCRSVWGFEVLVKRDRLDKLQQRYVKYVDLLEKNLISQEASGRAVEIGEIQDKDTSPSENTSENLVMLEGFEPPQEYVAIVQMQFMKDNQVWRLVNLPPNDIYMVKPEGFINPKHPRKVCKLQRSIYGLKQVSRSWNKRSDEEIKRFGFAQNLDEPCVTPEEVKRMKNVPYASAVESNICAVRYTRTNVVFAQYITRHFQQDRAELRVTCYCDVRFETDRDNVKSHTGYIFVLNGGAVDWKSSKQSTLQCSFMICWIPSSLSLGSRVLFVGIECGFLSQKGSGGGRGVKEKNVNVSNIEVVKDGAIPSVTVSSRSTHEENVGLSIVDMMVEMEKLSSLEDTTVLGSFPPLSTPVTTSAGNAPGKSSYANVTDKPSGKKLNIHTLYTTGGNGIDVVIPLVYRIILLSISYMDRLDAMLENVRVKLHGVPVMAFSEDGLSAIATQLGHYARVMIKLRADVELKDNIVVVMTKIIREGHYICAGEKKTLNKPSQTSRGVSVGLKIVLNSVDNDVELGANRGNTNLVNNETTSSGSSFMNIDNSSTRTTPIIDKIRKFEELLTSRKATLVDEAGNPLKKVEFLDDYDSEDEVVSVDNDMAHFMASKRVGFGTQSLLEQ
ncbi:zinc finger, CCHC-type containing protein [Tanacetum coccineum]